MTNCDNRFASHKVECLSVVEARIEHSNFRLVVHRFSICAIICGIIKNYECCIIMVSLPGIAAIPGQSGVFACQRLHVRNPGVVSELIFRSGLLLT
jgi:hypothetical protein